MPKPPGIFDRVNYVVRSWNNPCDLPWALVVETAAPAALEAFIAVACFGFTDLIRFLFRPARLRSGRHLRRGKKGRPSRKPMAIASRQVRKLPPLKALRNRKVTQGVATLWVIDGIGQRLLWWWLVADVASQFFYKWTTLIQKTEACQRANAPGAGLREDAQGGLLAIQSWPPIGYPTLHYQKGSTVVGSFAWTVGDGRWAVVGSAQIKNTFNLTIFVRLRVRVEGVGGTELFESGGVSISAGDTADFVAVANFSGAGFGAIEAQLDQGFAEVVGGAIYIQGFADTPNPPLKYDCLSKII